MLADTWCNTESMRIFAGKFINRLSAYKHAISYWNIYKGEYRDHFTFTAI